MGAQHVGLKYGPAGAVRREQGFRQRKAHLAELRSEDAIAIAAFRSMARDVKLTHRAANKLIEEAQRNGNRYDIVTGWSGKVGV